MNDWKCKNIKYEFSTSDSHCQKKIPSKLFKLTINSFFLIASSFKCFFFVTFLVDMFIEPRWVVFSWWGKEFIFHFSFTYIFTVKRNIKFKTSAWKVEMDTIKYLGFLRYLWSNLFRLNNQLFDLLHIPCSVYPENFKFVIGYPMIRTNKIKK